MSKLRVFSWASDTAGCQALRIRYPADALNARYDDIEVRYGTTMSQHDRDWADVVVGQRLCLPGPTYFFQEWRKQGDKVLIYELDDDVWSIPESNRSASPIFNNLDVRRRILRSVESADYVTVSTPPLKEAVHRNTGFPLDRIVVVENALPPSLILEDFDQRWDNSHFSVGYQASPTHEEDFKRVERYLRQFLKNNPGTVFNTIGADYSSRLKLPGQTHHTPWVSPPEEAVRILNFAVSIAPLTPTIFNKSKSSLKFLEASARGIPSIVSDVTSYDVVVHGETGYKVRRDHEWGTLLQRVYDDPGDALRVARNAWTYVREHRTTDNTVSQWYEVLSRGKAT